MRKIYLSSSLLDGGEELKKRIENVISHFEDTELVFYATHGVKLGEGEFNPEGVHRALVSDLGLIDQSDIFIANMSIIQNYKSIDMGVIHGLGIAFALGKQIIIYSEGLNSFFEWYPATVVHNIEKLKEELTKILSTKI